MYIMTKKHSQNQPEDTLFDVSQSQLRAPKPKNTGKARLLRAERSQIELCPLSLDDRLPQEHPARDIWALIQDLDLSHFDDTIKSIEGHQGRPAIDKRILLALWVYAYSQGITSGRHIDRLCREHDAYKWLAGNVSLNYHTIDDFRTQYYEQLQELTAQVLAVIMDEGLIEVYRTAIDGTKIHACAKESRFHREGTINEKLEAARRHLDAVNKEAEDNVNVSLRKKKARERAANERVQKLEHALEQLEDIRSRKKKSDAKDARASVTDPEARIMQVSKGAYAPGFNVQVATDMDTGVILGSVLLQDNDDSHGLPKVVPEIEKNTGKSPTILATDVKYTNHGHLDYCDREDMSLYSPPAEEQDKVKKSSPGNGYLKENSEIDVEACELTCPAGNIFKLYKNPPSVGAHKFQFKRRKDMCSTCPLASECCPEGKFDREASITVRTERMEKLVAEHKERHESDLGKELHKLRFQNELANAILKERMHLRRFHVQGMERARSELLLVVIAYNVLKWKFLRGRKAAPTCR